MNTSIGPWNKRLRQERLQRNWRQRDVAGQLGTTVATVTRWEQGTHQPSSYFRVKLCALFGKSPLELGFVQEDPSFSQQAETEKSAPIEPDSHPLNSPSFWNVPHPRNPFFTGREEILSHLHEQLNREQAMALTQSWAISGLGGIGKTQIALEYVYQYHHEYAAVFWISAATRETLLDGYVLIADLLQLPEKNDRDHNRVIQAVRQWLATHQRWLLILDNADDLAIVRDVLPAKRSGHLLLTTRAQALGTLAHQVEIDTMGMAEGTLFLLRRAKLLAPDATLDQVPEKYLAAAEAIVIEMDFLPLALDQAGAYIDEVGCDLAAYLELYRAHRVELLQRRGRVPTDHPESVATTWSLNSQKVEQADPVAADLLRLCAFLEPDAIPEELFSEKGTSPHSVLQPLAPDALTLNAAIEELRKYSLVQRYPESRLLHIHRLVQIVLKESMGIDEQRCWAERAICGVNALFPDTIELATWPLCRRYLSQAQVCSVLIQHYACTSLEAASLLFRTASYLLVHALHEQAEPLYQQTLHIREQILEPGHPDIAEPLHGLAHLYYEQGKYELAESLYQRALDIRERALGPEHPDVANTLHGLAILYTEQGRYELAEPLYQRALCIREQTLGPDQADVADSINKLAHLLYRQGKYREAMLLSKRALRIRERILGPQHPDVAQSLDLLGILYMMQGGYKQAEPLFQRALRIWEQTLGSEHPDVASPCNNLAELYTEQGKYKQAELLFQRALRIWEQALGPEHANLAYTLHGLAKIYTGQGKYEQAELLFQRTLRIWEQALGPEHPHVGHALHGLAEHYAEQGKYREAEQFYQRALCIWEQALGSENPNVAHAFRGLARVYAEQGKYREAEQFYQRVLHIWEQTLGPDHPLVAESLRELERIREDSKRPMTSLKKPLRR
jgi:tetratricopeptide (TPR) repeat protein/transcriptional regulator with XRE-family HTH domain